MHGSAYAQRREYAFVQTFNEKGYVLAKSSVIIGDMCINSFLYFKIPHMERIVKQFYLRMY